MRFAKPGLFTVVCLLGLAGRFAQGRDELLSAIPGDATGFVVIHNLAETSKAIGESAKLLRAPVPDLLNLAKGMTGMQKGIDEQGDLALVLTGVELLPKFIVLVPVASFDDLYAGLNLKGAATDIVESQVFGRPIVIGRKGTFAAIAPAADRESLEKFLAGSMGLDGDVSLHNWVAANRLSVALTSSGIKNLLPKAVAGIRSVQAQFRKTVGPNGEAAASGMNMYIDLFTAAQTEVEQFGVGLGIDSSQTIDLTSRTKFNVGGAWAKWAAESKPNAQDLLAGLEAKPYVIATGATASQAAMQAMMKMSVKMMQNQPNYKLTPEQAQKYSDVFAGMVSGVKSGRILMGVADPAAGLYSNTSVVVTVDDSKAFLAAYEKSLAEARTLMIEINNPAMPAATTQHIKIGDLDVLEVSMKFPDLKQVSGLGAADANRMMQLFAGPDGKLTTYIAAADEHTVVMAYISPEHLKEAIAFQKSQKPGLSADPGVASVAAKLPKGAQMVGYASLNGLASFIKQMMTAVPKTPAAKIPDFPDCPPLGFAVEISPAGVVSHLVITAESLRTIGDTVAKARNETAQQRSPQ